MRYKEKLKLIEERGHRCEKCKRDKWFDKPIPIETHHTSNNDIELLCPNCHAFTDNYRGRGITAKKKATKISDDEFIKIVGSSESIRQVLIKMKLAPKGGNYKTIRNRLERLNLSDKFKVKNQTKICIECGIEIAKNKFCSRSCSAKFNSLINNGHKTKINWPSVEVVSKMVETMGYSKTGRILGVSDNGVRKFLKRWQNH